MDAYAMRSLSARRAWIEIGASHNFCIFLSVALRKESVDRNSTTRIGKKVENTSLSARRAWIEMSSPWNDHRAITSLSARRAWIEIILIIIMLKRLCVALRKESVDRNTQRRDFKALGLRRSP